MVRGQNPNGQNPNGQNPNGQNPNGQNTSRQNPNRTKPQWTKSQLDKTPTDKTPMDKIPTDKTPTEKPQRTKPQPLILHVGVLHSHKAVVVSQRPEVETAPEGPVEAKVPLRSCWWHLQRLQLRPLLPGHGGLTGTLQ